MLEETARVVKISAGQVWVVGENSSCAGCGQQASCSTATLGKLLKNKEMLVNSRVPVEVGDQVIVGVEESVLLRAAFSLYLVPLLALFIGAGLADWLTDTNTPYADIWVAGGGLSGLGAALWAVRQRKNTVSQHAVVVKKC